MPTRLIRLISRLIASLSYDHFLTQRRKLMAQVVRDAVARIADPSYVPAPPQFATAAEVRDAPLSTVRELVDADLLPRDAAQPQTAQVLPDGRLYADGETYDSLIDLSEGLQLTGNPWSAWAAELADGRIALNVLRDAYKERDGTETQPVSREISS